MSKFLRFAHVSGIVCLLFGLLFYLTMIVDLPPASGQAAQAMGNTIYVDIDASGTNDGTSWVNAYTDLQPAMDAAVEGDQVWVAAGTYLPMVEKCGVGERYKTFQLKNGVGVYGGFDPSTGDKDWDDRDWVANEVILSGDIGIQGDNGDNSYHVFCHPQGLNLDNSAILDGFLIQDGNADSDSFPGDGGGGMFNYGSSPTLTNVTFSENITEWSGGGIANVFSSPTLTNVTFSENIAANNPYFSSCMGGGMYNTSYSSPTLTNVTFSNNIADTGGGMDNDNYSSPTLTDVTFTYNFASGSGGGMLNMYSSSPTLTNVTFSNNSTTNNGGGMFNYDSCSPALTNVTFSGNTSAAAGGGMYNGSSSPTLTNVTFSGNTADYYGGGLFNGSSSPSLTNSILWGNIPDEIYDDNSNPIVIYSDVQGGYSGEGNIDLDPLLGPLADNGGFVLTHALIEGSPAIDTGNPDPATCPAADARGAPRPVDGDGDSTAVCDMGAYEYLSEKLTTTTAITSDLPDPSMRGQAFIVTFEVTSTVGIPTGVVTVTVSNEAGSCSAELVDGLGSCSLMLTDPGSYTLTAEYGGDDSYLPSTSVGEAHDVEVIRAYLAIIIK